jgi:hypothetical protein
MRDHSLLRRRFPGVRASVCSASLRATPSQQAAIERGAIAAFEPAGH